AAKLVHASYRAEPFQTDFLTRLDRGEALPSFGVPPDASHGDVAAAESGAEVRVEGVYLTSDRHHNAMEPSATLAVWDDGHLMMRDTVQGVVAARALIAQALDLDPARVRVINEYVGGGF